MFKSQPNPAKPAPAKAGPRPASTREEMIASILGLWARGCDTVTHDRLARAGFTPREILDHAQPALAEARRRRQAAAGGLAAIAGEGC